jgi:two-component system response regulator DevR
MTTVFLVDDHELVRAGIAAVINAQPDLEVVGESDTVAHTLPRVAATRPDVVVLDMRLPDGNGIDLCRQIRSAHPEMVCLILTAYDDDDALRAATLAGAAGYVLKDVRGTRLIDGIRDVASGRSLFSAQARHTSAVVLAETIGSSSGGATLTPRERDILDLIVEGLTNRQIGERLHIAEKTVKNNVTSVLLKMGFKRRTQAAVYRATHNTK